MIAFAIGSGFAIVLLYWMVLVLSKAQRDVPECLVGHAHTRIDFLWDELEIHDKRRLVLEKRIVELEAEMLTFQSQEEADDRAAVIDSQSARIDKLEVAAEKYRRFFQALHDRSALLK